MCRQGRMHHSPKLAQQRFVHFLCYAMKFAVHVWPGTRVFTIKAYAVVYAWYRRHSFLSIGKGSRPRMYIVLCMLGHDCNIRYQQPSRHTINMCFGIECIASGWLLGAHRQKAYRNWWPDCHDLHVSSEKKTTSESYMLASTPQQP